MILGANGEIVNNDNYQSIEASNESESVSPNDNSSELVSSETSVYSGNIKENTTKNTIAKSSGNFVINIFAVILIPLLLFLLLGAGIIVSILLIKNKRKQENDKLN